MEKKTVIKKSISVGGATFLSRMLGFARDILLFKYYLGPGILSDAFMTAYRLPNSLRKIFAEGAVSSSLTPTLVHAHRNDSRSAVNSLICLSLLVFEGVLLLICAITIWKTEFVVNLVAPGFTETKIAYTIPLLRILMPLIILISSSAIFASALQSVNHFFIPAVAPVLFNILFISSIGICIVKHWNPEFFCYLILAAAFAQLILHVVVYVKFNFSVARIKQSTWEQFGPVGIKFLFCFIATGLSEISLIIDMIFSSYLKDGSITLMHCATRFMALPMGIFATSLATIMLPYVSRISAYAPKRLSFCLHEITKLVLWVTIPATILMVFFSEKLFHTLYLSSKFTIDQVLEAGTILAAFAVGIFALSLNRMVLNIYYALHTTWLPALISGVATVANIVLNFIFIRYWQATGIAIATTLTIGFLQMIMLLTVLYFYFGIGFHRGRMIQFIGQYALQLLVIFTPFYGLYMLVCNILSSQTLFIKQFFLYGIGFWLWTGPLCLIAGALIFFTRKQFKINLYFID